VSVVRTETTNSLIDALDDIFFAVNNSGYIELWNQAAAEITGYTNAEAGTMTPADFFDPPDRDRVTDAINEVLQTGSTVVQAELVTADGDRIPYEFKAKRLPEDSPYAFAGIGHDNTDRKVAERERNAILNRMRDGFFAVDTDWRIIYANEKGKQVLANAMGHPLEETTFEGLHLWDEIPDAVDTTFYEEYHRAMETDEPVSFEEYFAPLDEWFDVRAFPDETGLSIYFREITEQRQYREELEHREQVLKELYSITADRETTFTKQVQHLLALGRAEFGTEYGSLSEIRGDEYLFEVVAADDDSLQAGDTVPLEATNCELVATQRETIAWGNIAQDAPEHTDRAGYTDWGISCYLGAPVYDDDGVYGTFCFYGTDTRAEQFSEWEVTLVDLMSRWVSYELQRKQVTAELQRQNERLEQFAGIISHDLRNPLNVLSGRLELAKETGDAEEFARCFDAVERMEVLIGDLLSLSQAGKAIDTVELVALGEIVESAWESVPTDNATLQTTANLTVPADASRLQQLFENLFRNAIEHGEPAVTVTVGAVEHGFYVEDDGPGLPEDSYGEVFESGYSTTTSGTGFGLAIVADIVKAHGWEIRVAESESGGARFEITGID
jgi:PAS domain S-box-containing protein